MSSEPEKIRVSWEQYFALVHKLLRAIQASGFKPKQIIAIARGGCFPADAASRFFDDVPFAVMAASSYPGAATQAGKLRLSDAVATVDPLVYEDVLLVDDLTETGATLLAAVKWLEARHGIPPQEVRTAVVFHKRKSSLFEPNYCAEVIQAGPDGRMPWVIQPFDSEFRTGSH